MFFYIIHQISRNVLFLPDFIISLYYARESVIAKITFEVSRIFCLQRLTNWYIHSIHKCLKPFDCPYCDYKCVRKENIYVYNIHGHKEYWCIFPWIFTNSILALCPEETWMWIMWKIFYHAQNHKVLFCIGSNLWSSNLVSSFFWSSNLVGSFLWSSNLVSGQLEYYICVCISVRPKQVNTE